VSTAFDVNPESTFPLEYAGTLRKQGRSQCLDAARFLAAAAIVWLHAMGGSPTWYKLANLGRFSVPFFVISAMVLIGESLRRKPESRFEKYASGRSLRIIGPLLVWSAVFVAARLAKHHFQPSSPAVVFPPLLFFGLAMKHLWFMPFILVSSLVAFPVERIMLRDRQTGRIIAIVAALAGVAACFMDGRMVVPSDRGFRQDLIILWDYSEMVMPALLWGLALSPFYPQVRQWLDENPAVAGGAGILMIALLLCVTIWGRNKGLENCAGLCLLLLACGPWHGRSLRFAAYLGRYAYGIYMTHPLFLLGFYTLLLHDHSEAPLSMLVIAFTLALPASLLLCYVLSLSRWTRWLVI
jgi:peptidoglycan/LPS O-acetylase OafA/YrhL